MAATLDLEIPQSADYVLGLSITGTTGAAYNLNSCSFLSQIRAFPGAAVVATFTASVIDASNGTAKLTLSNSVTRNIPPGVYFYDVLLTKSDTTKSRILQGKAVVSSAISIPS